MVYPQRVALPSLKRFNRNAHKFNYVVKTLANKNFDFKKYEETCAISQMTKDVPIEFILR